MLISKIMSAELAGDNEDGEGGEDGEVSAQHRKVALVGLRHPVAEDKGGVGRGGHEEAPLAVAREGVAVFEEEADRGVQADGEQQLRRARARAGSCGGPLCSCMLRVLRVLRVRARGAAARGRAWAMHAREYTSSSVRYEMGGTSAVSTC